MIKSLVDIFATLLMRAEAVLAVLFVLACILTATRILRSVPPAAPPLTL
jgi:hypothetical protein